MDLALNNQQRLICHKTQPNQTKLNFYGKFNRFEFSFPLTGLVNIVSLKSSLCLTS